MLGSIKVAVIGVGNCASSLLQGLAKYKKAGKKIHMPGVTHSDLGGYGIADIEVVAAFDVNADKIGKDVSEAIFVAPNSATQFAEVPKTDVVVHPGYVGDSIASHITDIRLVEDPVRVQSVLRHSGAEVCVNFLPVGSQKTAEFYANACLRTGTDFINAMPALIASDPQWEQRFARAGLRLSGDDVMSQCGATWVHRKSAADLRARGFTIESTVQINQGSNRDFWNMRDRSRLATKLLTKSDHLKRDAGTDNVIVETEYVEGLGDRKIATITFEGRQFGGLPYRKKIELEVEDSPNSAGSIVDVIRIHRIARDRGMVGFLAPSANYFKRPRDYVPISQTRKVVEEFIAA